MLEPQGVAGGQHHVAGSHRRQLPPGGEADEDPGRHQGHAEGPRHGDRDGARRHRPVPLGRVEPIGVHVADVVEVIGAAGRQAEGYEGHQAGDEVVGLAQHAGGPGGGEHQHVLGPLPGPQQPHQPYGEQGRRRTLGVRRGGHW